MDFDLSVQMAPNGRAVIAAKGRLNAVTAPAMKAQIAKLIEDGHAEVVCDLGAVGFIDSSGLSALVSGLKATREHGGFLKLAGVNDQVARIFKLTMLDRVFEMHPSVEAAVA
jgi:anti-sigma B factor antagonist